MNIRLLAKFLGTLSGLIGAFMILSLPWALPRFGRRSGGEPGDTFEAAGFNALLVSTVVCFVMAGVLYYVGRRATDRLYRKEAMAVVGLSWILATVLGALPYWLSGTYRGPSIRVFETESTVLLAEQNWQLLSAWRAGPELSTQQYAIIRSLAQANPGYLGLSLTQLRERSGVADADDVFRDLIDKPVWHNVLIAPGEGTAPSDRASNYRVRWIRMTVWDALFESQSGFSTTGASVISELEDPELVPNCIHFWRSSTHFLGGLGIIVLFVVVLGQGSAGKALMRTEVPGPTAEGTAPRMQHSAWVFAGIYVALNIILSLLLMALGMSGFDALCHAFGTMATGGFSTYNLSIGHFTNPAIQYVVILFMILAGTNFTLMYLFLLGRWSRMFRDIEWRTYLVVIVVVTAIIVVLGMRMRDPGFDNVESAFRYGLFQVTSIITTTGFGTNDFDAWNQTSRLMLLVLMFVGGCAGSTGGGMKVIRHVLFAKILWIEIEKSFRPRLVRPLRAGDGTLIADEDLRHNILVYFALVLTLFVFGWLFVVTIEPDNTWGDQSSNKLIDSASAVISTLNNIGPGLGIVARSQNYSNFSGITKILFVWMMMLGRLEIWPILVLFAPSFWRNQ